MPLGARVLAVLHPVCAVLGVALLAMLVQRAGAEELGRELSRAAPWLPLVLMLEVTRLFLDALATRVAYGSRAREVPWRRMLRAQLIGTAVSSVSPTGRASGEAAKAALLGQYTGGATALAAAATSQAASLVSGGLICLLCAFAAYLRTGASWLTLVFGVHALVLLLMGLGMHAGTKGRALPPARTLLAALLGRTLQVVQYGILAMAVGIDTTVVEALIAQGLHLVSLAVGALVPGQFGVREGAFALSAGAFGTTPARAMSIALLAHGTQGLFVLLGSLTPLVWKVQPPGRP
ncbi:lysylphosphatidylglycerol synthase transmembrane domain-containing protein [Archangium sp. Cb G35]|uniref:lysylphosphatidylglycerol synthase transmembrane domain-containing protein n=1 Tax=Archangium sp. Cb G35 TaxID=1920190 RepID=UPI001E29F6C8|nr:lysylphosphatidylglycerol synthase domain-containing protein [Archangium sp. Cb G35]